MNQQEAENEFAPILEQQRKHAGLFEPVARGMELSVAQQIERMKCGGEQLTPGNCYEHGFQRINGRFV